MAKNKKREAPHYEILFIVPNKFTIEELKPILEKIKKIITDNGGEITYSEKWGNKKLAYKIHGFSHGYYNLFEFDAPSEKANQINNIIKMDNDIIRHLIIAKEKRSADEILSEKKIEKARRDASRKENEAKEAKNEPKRKVKAPTEKKKEEVSAKKPEEEKQEKDKKKVSLDDLDDKLDKILETNDLL